jgi:hypothetical protein
LAITQRQKDVKWGTQVVEKLSADIQREFPGIEGFSKRNVFIMRSFYQTYVKVQ